MRHREAKSAIYDCLVSSEPSSCEALLAVAEANKNAVGRSARWKADSESSDDPCVMAKASRQLAV